jgi:TRAP-type C4-dicarboxylate transport system permease small subunit
MRYKKLFFFFGLIILGIVLTNLTWFFRYPVAPWAFGRGLPFPFFEEVTECLLPCPPPKFYWDIYLLDLFFWIATLLIITQIIKLLAKLTRKIEK